MAKSLINNIPSFLKSALDGSRAVTLKGDDFVNTNSSSTASFIYNPAESPLKSTQQINVDWSKFENHTFFAPATINVNSAFDKIINRYPFDGTRIEVENFFENLSGYENYILTQFPKYRGQLLFEIGSYISVIDNPGALFPELIKENLENTNSVLSPLEGEPLTIEMHLFVPSQINGNEILLQKVESTSEGHVGFSLILSESNSTDMSEVIFYVASGSSELSTSVELQKGKFSHLLAEFNNTQYSNQKLRLVVDSKENTTTNSYDFIGSLSNQNCPLLIGSGSTEIINGVSYLPSETFNGVLDELRIFKSIRSQKDIDEYTSKSLFARDDLILYYKFNEPAPPLVSSLTDVTNAIILDSSGNSLHSYVVNFNSSLRINSTTSPYGDPMNLEKLSLNPILFPAHTSVTLLNTELLTSASNYDEQNPNIITKLVPQHFFLEGQSFEGLTSEDGTIKDVYTSTSIPGTGKLGSSQLLMSLLYVYAKFFDDMKLFVDSFSNLQYVDYDKVNNIPDTFLHKMLMNYGFVIPPMFSNSTIEQYVDSENIQYPISTGENSLKYIQNELLRRLLVNIPDIIRSKGTQYSIKAFLRSLGIDPENSCRIKEYGGPTKVSLGTSRELKREVGSMCLFEDTTKLISPFLSSSRIEIGYPYPIGTFVNKNEFNPHGISDNVNDGLLTSGSWTIESIVKFTDSRTPSTSGYDSLIRLCTSGSTSQMEVGLVSNLISDEENSTLTWYLRASDDNNAQTLTLSLNDIDLYSNDLWNISFGKIRGDSINNVSSSFFLRAAKNINGEIKEYSTTSSYFNETDYSGGTNCLTNISSLNLKGLYIAIGNGQTFNIGSTTSYKFLNNTLSADSHARETQFTGLMSNLRFWSKDLSESEWKEHVKNYNSVGVENPLTNYNYVHTPSGSFEKLRLSTLIKQDEIYSNNLGNITLIDYSDNNLHLEGSGYTINSQILIPQIFESNFISPSIDESVTENKIRPRGFLDYSNVLDYQGSELSPIYEINPSEIPYDDTRLSVEFSLIESLNRDIITIFSTLDILDNILGDQNLLFSQDYPGLENLRTIYFNKLTDKLNFKAFHEFFKFFDISISTFIEQLLPKKTKFKGLNFVIESHMLERHKLEYYFNQMYLTGEERYDINHTLLLQQLVGIVRKY